MRILVTGGSGFIATYFRAHHHLKQHQFIYSTTSPRVQKDAAVVAVSRSYDNLDEALGDDEIGAIVHMAAAIPTNFAQADYRTVLLPNLEMMNNLYEVAVKRRVQKFVYLSTFGSMTDARRLDVKDFYTLSKICGEHFCAMLSAQGVQAASLRISSPYGEHSSKNTVLNNFVRKAMQNQDIHVYGTGARSQNFVYAGDVVQAVERCFETTAEGVFSIVGRANTTMLQLAHAVVEAAQSTSRIIVGQNPDPQDAYVFPHAIDRRTETELGYQPRFDLKEGLQRYVAWLKSSVPAPG